ncbi:MAG: ABC transporter ATP-binding protein/permease [Alphaproteobacteria bacterium]|nr:ABC transporter ATP-binding protein/permease [Alphaproteobacteria bacterium]
MNPFLKEVGQFFLPFLKADKGKIFILLTLPILWCFAETAAPYLIKLLIDFLVSLRLNSKALFNMFFYVIIAYSGLILCLEISTRVSNYVWIKTFPQVRARIQSKILETLQHLPFQFIQDHFSGDLVSKCRSLTESFEKISSTVLYGFYPTLLSFLFSLLFILFISPIFAAIFFLWFVAMLSITAFYFQKSILASKTNSKNLNILYGYMGNFISNPFAFNLSSQNLTQERRFIELNKNAIASTEIIEFLTFKTDVWRSLFSWILLVGMMISLTYGWYNGSITLGDFAFIGTVCFYVRRLIWIMSIQMVDFFREIGSVHEALSLISNAEIVKETVSNGKFSGEYRLLNSISFEKVSFSYDQQEPLFQNLSLSIRAGQKVGVFGPSGTGKTSLAHLLLGLNKPHQGQIRFDGKDLEELSFDEKKNLFSYAPQHGSLLHRSIFDNIAFGRLDASREEVLDAAQTCLCDEFVKSLKDGYDTVIGEGGYKLSGGQRQRIAIARAYLKKAPILILDEATSGLDPNLEENLLLRLCKGLKKQTLIFISHRRAGLLQMERVIEIRNGCVVEQ